jgi:hypothetical protein
VSQDSSMICWLAANLEIVSLTFLACRCVYTHMSSKESQSASDGHPSASVPLPV